MMSERPRTALIVTGMHRSGTSAMARMLSLLGARLPRNLVPESKWNERGHWEPIELIRIHDQILEHAGTSWHDLAPIPAFWKSQQFIEQFMERITETLSKEYESAGLFILKDPRISRFVPFTRALLDEANISPRFIIMVRNPLEVAASLRNRNGFNISRSLLLWLDHTLRAERETRGTNRTLVHYDSLLADWRTVVHNIIEQLDITLPSWSLNSHTRIESFLTTDLQHHSFTVEELAEHKDVPIWVTKAYRALTRYGKGDTNLHQKKLDEIWEQFAIAQSAYGPLQAFGGDMASHDRDEAEGQLFEERQKETARSKPHESTGSRSSVQVGVEDLRRESLQLRKEVEQAQQLVSELGKQATELEARNRDLKERLRGKDEEILQLDGQLRAARSQSAKLRSTIEVMTTSKSWRLTAPLRSLMQSIRDIVDASQPGIISYLGITYERLPLPTYIKDSVKSILFRSIPRLFRKSRSYWTWLVQRRSNHKASHLNERLAYTSSHRHRKQNQLSSGTAQISLQAAIREAENAMNDSALTKSIGLWTELLEAFRNNDTISSLARANISVARRISAIKEYQQKFQEYRSIHPASGTHIEAHEQRLAIYTAISANYDSLKLPEEIDPRLGYFLFTDGPIQSAGIHQHRPITFFHEDPTRTARFVKTHPHLLLPEFDIVVWVDANIYLLGDIYPLILDFIDSGKPIGAIPHPYRNSVYEELEECLRLDADDPGIMTEQIFRYRQKGFEGTNLIETNVMAFNLNHARTVPFLNFWWSEIDQFSRRDQLSVNFAMNHTGVEWHKLMNPPRNVRNHPKFARVSHDVTGDPASKLNEALKLRFVDPYQGDSYSLSMVDRMAIYAGRSADIIVCVHNALEDVKRCLRSIDRARQSKNHKAIIVDDGSGYETSSFLREFASRREWITLQRNDEPLGYTKAANLGLELSSGDLVILLNSDTVVSPFWLEKMMDAVFSTKGAGIVGPLSNAASYQSIPSIQGTKNQSAINSLPPNTSIEQMNSYCEKWSVGGVLPLVPLLHGFCYGITREAIGTIGLFDEETFPQGYGEENDYSLRATDSGFCLVVATHTYVYHEKSRSYPDEVRIPLMRSGQFALENKHEKDRIQRAVKSMKLNPILNKFRKEAARLMEST